VCGVSNQDLTIRILDKPELSFYHVDTRTISYRCTESSGSNVTYNIDFGDGFSSDTNVGHHEYNSIGIYTVTATVTDVSSGFSKSTSKEIEIIRYPFSLEVTGPYDRVVNCDGSLDNNQTTWVNIYYSPSIIPDKASVFTYEKYCDEHTLINGECDAAALSMIDYSTAGIVTPLESFEYSPGNTTAPSEIEMYCIITYMNISYKTEVLYFSCTSNCN